MSQAPPVIVLCHTGDDDLVTLGPALASVGRLERAGSLEHAVEALALDPAACLVADLPPDRDGRALLGRIVAAYPQTSVIVLAASLPFELARELLHAGVRDVLPLPADPAALVGAVRGAFGDRRDAAGGLRGTSVAVASGKGGTGCTVLALHLAAAFVEHGAVALVDADVPPFGGLAVAAGIDPDGAAPGLVRRHLPVEFRALRHASHAHPAGFDVFALWAPAADLDHAADATAAALDALAGAYPFVVTDVGRPVLALQRLVLRRATLIVATSTLDLLSLRNLRQLADLVSREAGTDGPFLPVLNRCGAGASYTVAQAAAAFGRPFAAVLPESPGLEHRLDGGELALGPGPEAGWARAVRQFAGEIVAHRRADARRMASAVPAPGSPR